MSFLYTGPTSTATGADPLGPADLQIPYRTRARLADARSMAHRDDYQAALMRIEALEEDLQRSEQDSADKAKELARLRKEVARLGKALEKEELSSAAESAKRRKRRATTDEGADENRIKLTVAAILVPVAALAAALIFLPSYCARRTAENDPGRVEHLRLVSAGDTPRLLVTTEIRWDNEHNDGYFWRLDLMDVASGKRIKRLVINRKTDNGVMSQLNIRSATPTTFWMSYRRGNREYVLEQRSATTLEVTRSMKRFQALVPELAAGIQESPSIHTPTGTAIVTTRRGDILHIDPETGKGRDPGPRQGTPRERDEEAFNSWPLGTSSYFRDGDVEFSLFSPSSDPKEHLTRRVHGEATTTLPEAVPLLQPHFIRVPRRAVDGGNTYGVVRAPSGGFVVTHRDRLGEITKDNPNLLSGFSATGARLWQTKLPGRSLASSLVIGNTLIIESSGSDFDYLTAIDLESGAIRWRATP